MKNPLVEFEVPNRLRAFVRARESSLIVLGAVVGALAGVVTALMGYGVDLLHSVLFGLRFGERLSAVPSLDPLRALLVPTLGGVALGFAFTVLARRRPAREIDPIEANALHGGRMSSIGSLIVAAQTVWSSGVGASVGLEAGYTQLASGIASRIGRAFRLRRADLRILVGCGAAGGIAGAFGAPLAGAFYAFELVIGNYSVASLAPVAVAALVGYLVAANLLVDHVGIVAPHAATITNQDLVVAALLGLAAALFGIAVMRGVAFCEFVMARFIKHAALRAGLGGLGVGLLALVTPQVMSSGHGALHLAGMLDLPLHAVVTILVLKAVGSIISLGAGFRGGLFFSSLLLGALGGQAFATVVNMALPATYFDPDAYAVIGMGALSASVIGGPMTMIFIALETTGDFWLDRRRDDRRHRLGAGDAGAVRLFVRDLAFPPARRNHPQRRRRRLDPRSHGRADDAARRAHHPGGNHHRGVSCGISARLAGMRRGDRRRGALCRPRAGRRSPRRRIARHRLHFPDPA